MVRVRVRSRGSVSPHKASVCLHVCVSADCVGDIVPAGRKLIRLYGRMLW